MKERETKKKEERKLKEVFNESNEKKNTSG